MAKLPTSDYFHSQSLLDTLIQKNKLCLFDFVIIIRLEAMTTSETIELVHGCLSR